MKPVINTYCIRYSIPTTGHGCILAGVDDKNKWKEAYTKAPDVRTAMRNSRPRLPHGSRFVSCKLVRG